MSDQQELEPGAKQMEQEELKEETTLDFDPSTLVNDAESNENLTIKDELDEEIPEAATVGFDDFGEEDQ